MSAKRTWGALALVPLLVLPVLAGCGGGTSKGGNHAVSHDPSSLGAFEPKNPSAVIARINVGGHPCGVEKVDGTLWVTDAENAQLLKIDIDSAKLIAKFPIDQKPCELQFSRRALWVVTQSGFLDRVDPSSGTVLKRFPVGEGSYESIDAFGSIWVTNRNSRSMTQIDPASDKVVATISLPEIAPGGLVSTEDGYIWIGDDTSGSTKVLKYSPTTKQITRVTAGKRPAFVTATGDDVWVANQEDHTVSDLDAKTGALKHTIPAGESPVNLDSIEAGTWEVWVPDDRGSLLTRIDAHTGQPVERIQVDAGPAVVRVTSTSIWVTNYDAGTIWGFLPGPR